MAVIVSGQGDIQGVTSLNSGSFTFRNILYNGWVNTPDEINQRNLTFAAASDGDYWADRWKRVSSTTMTQIVEEGNYIPNRTYTLSGTNVTTTQVTAPSSGNWDWGTVSNTASLVQLELGTVASSFEYRPNGLELSLCQRYYDKSYSYETSPGTDFSGTASPTTPPNVTDVCTGEVTAPTNSIISTCPRYATIMRTIPTIQVYDLAGNSNRITTSVDNAIFFNGNIPTAVDGIGDRSFKLFKSNNSNLQFRILFFWTADAEI